MKTLWPHQAEALEALFAKYAEGVSRLAVVMPTGGGKSALAGATCHRYLKEHPDQQVLALAHRDELVTQLYDEFEEWGLECGVIQAKPSRTANPFRPVQIASVQTLLARGIGRLNPGLIVPDEFHHYASDQWSGPLKEWPDAKILALTATPVRLDGRSLEGLVDDLICPVTTSELIAAGHLTDFEMKHPGRKLGNDQIAQHPLIPYKEFANGRKAIGFAKNVKAGEDYTRDFNEDGIKSALITGKTPSGERRRIVDAYKDGEIRVLWNVGVLTEGFDDKETSCVIIARGVGSLSLWIQILGRGLRCYPGKDKCIFLDLNGTSQLEEFGDPRTPREWTLEGDGIVHRSAEKIEEKFCKVCGLSLGIGGDVTACALCVIVTPDMKPPEIANIKLVGYPAKKREPIEVRQKYFHKLVAIGVSKKYSPWWAVKQYEVCYGERPPKTWMYAKS